MHTHLGGFTERKSHHDVTSLVNKKQISKPGELKLACLSAHSSGLPATASAQVLGCQGLL